MIGYLLRRLSDVPAGDDWLTPAERQWYTDRRSAKRVTDWRLGRWTAKVAARTFLEHLGRPVPGRLEILAADDGAPELRAAGQPLPLSVSISHSGGRALCAVASAPAALGCDLEEVEPRSPAFVESYCTSDERAALLAAEASQRDLLVNLVWSAKESALKSLRRGLRADARSVEVRLTGPPTAGWGWLEVRPGDGEPLTGRWTRLNGLVATIVGRPSPEELADLARGPEPGGAPPSAGRLRDG